MIGQVFAPNLFDGRIALITGGGSGIGFAIAEQLGVLGASVTIASRNAERLGTAAQRLKSRNVNVNVQSLDIRDERQVAAAFDNFSSQGRLPDILVNNAGGQFEADALRISANGFRAVVDLNLTGTWHMSQAFAARRIASGGRGHIINIVLSIAGGLPGYAHSAAARAGVISLTETLAAEWGPHITVNAVAPGTIRTSALAQYDISHLEAGIEVLPIRRMGEPDEVAAAVAYLASPAGDYITGTMLFIDGGKHLARGRPSKEQD
ncbi:MULTISPECIES: SDR family oxidoreductase [unclassified Mesorhizobium]|uniref:SDR family oxidoreductase n=1 Tax=unclassified Mesorhizobium TaxID=325217 RepID=UPI003335296C